DAVTTLVQKFGDRFRITEMLSWGEYLYNYSDLLDLPGKKYHSKRNHISQFKKLYPSSAFKEITTSDLPRIADFLDKYYAQTEKDQKMFNKEREMMKKILASYSELKVQSGYLEIDGEIAAFAMGETQGDTIYIHIEKADINFKGAYAAINNEYLKYFAAEGVSFVNREEDVGDAGLRKAKLSYHPVEIIKKYSVKDSNADI
ncbi:MAG: phosphatidylglycerol lysyltransferase domain-containing protein, partial [Clostridia bacterium]|nr:phosphatidylglycerol lysyltransferase domain-containing protein [Clostridia bacterium]